MLKALKSKFWDVQVACDSSEHVVFVQQRVPKLRKAARFVLSEWKFLATIGVAVAAIVFAR